VGVSLGGLVLGAIIGSIGGGLAAWTLRKLVQAEPRRAKAGAKSAKPGKDDREGKDTAVA
jgi:tetrahydromethanopterin S-methyltransferase subunit D